MSTALQTDSVDAFYAYVREQKQASKRQYDRNLNKDLAKQQSQQCLQRNVTATLQQLFADVLQRFSKLQSTSPAAADENASAIAEQALTTLDGFIDEFMQYVLTKHRSSCALSNFPEEHNPSREYLLDVLHAADAEWRLFREKLTNESEQQPSNDGQ